MESPSFVAMIRTLDPATKTMSQKTLGRRLLDRHEELETRIIKILADVPWVATTADCWAAHHNSYLAMTVHWIDPVTREQKQATLACQRLTGPHTFDVLARAISDIHCKFGVQDKVRRTTPDNAANFVTLPKTWQCWVTTDLPKQKKTGLTLWSYSAILMIQRPFLNLSSWMTSWVSMKTQQATYCLPI